MDNVTYKTLIINKTVKTVHHKAVVETTTEIKLENVEHFSALELDEIICKLLETRDKFIIEGRELFKKIYKVDPPASTNKQDGTKT